MRVVSRLTTCLLILGSCVFGAVHATENFPERSITLLIPYPPGGSADLLARPLAAEMQKELGKPVVIEYKPGAGGSIATSQLARSKADGYTLLMVLAAHTINPFLYENLPYNTKTDFAPVSLVATLPLVVAAPLTTPANSMSELIAYAKQNPGKLNYASAGPGNTSHLSVELFKLDTETDIQHIPYKGSGPAVVALLSGEVSFMFDSISTSLPHLQSGKLKALAVTGAARSPLLPDVPTVSESAVNDFVVNGWYGVLAPAGTPEAVIERLNQSFSSAAKVPAVVDLLERNGYSIVSSSPQEFESHIQAELERWDNTITKADITLE